MIPAFTSLCTTRQEARRNRHLLSVWLAAHTVAALLLGGCNTSTTTAPNASDTNTTETPALVFTPDTINFGTSKNREFRFPLSIRNRSQSAVRIEGIDKSCGCTVVNMTLPCDVPVGSTIHTVIQFSYSVSSRGAIAQHIKLRTSDPINPTYQIPIRGILEGEPEVKLQPEVIQFGMVGGWEAPSREVRVRYSAARDWEVQTVAPSDSHLTAVFERKESDGTAVYRVTLQKGFRIGPFFESVQFVTTHGSARLGVEGEQKSDLYTTPAFLRCLCCLRERVSASARKLAVHRLSDAWKCCVTAPSSPSVRRKEIGERQRWMPTCQLIPVVGWRFDVAERKAIRMFALILRRCIFALRANRCGRMRTLSLPYSPSWMRRSLGHRRTPVARTSIIASS